MADAQTPEDGGDVLRVRRRRRHRSSDDSRNITATEAAGIVLDRHAWHAGSGERRRGRSRGRDGRDRARRNVNPLVRRSNRIFVRMALLVLAGVAVYAAYQHGHRTGSAQQAARQRVLTEQGRPGAPTDSSEARRSALAEVEKGFEARKAGNFASAIERFQAAKDIDPRLRGAYVEMGLLWMRLRNPVEADNMFLRAIRLNDDLPRAHYHRGVLLAGSGSFPEAFVEFQTAAEEAPFDPYPWFFWGEALRAYGKPAEALEKFARAEVRAVEHSDLFVMRSKRLLSMVEANSPELLAQMEVELARPSPSGEWLLAGAALRLKGGDYEAAADLLRKARHSLQPIFFGYMVSDKFFDLYRGRKELADLLRPETP